MDNLLKMNSGYRQDTLQKCQDIFLLSRAFFIVSSRTGLTETLALPVRFTFFVGGCVGYATCRCVELFLSCHKYCFVFVFLSLYLQLYPPLFKYTTHHFYISCFLRNGYFHFHSFVFSIAYHVLYLGHSYRRPSYTIVNKVAKISGLLVHRC